MTAFDRSPIPVPASASWPALGTTALVLVTEPRLLDVARRAVAEVLADVDATYSRFRADSELCGLNEDAGRYRSVSPLMPSPLGTALRAARATGAPWIPIGRAVRILGYDYDFARLPRDGPAPAPTFRVRPRLGPFLRPRPASPLPPAWS